MKNLYKSGLAFMAALVLLTSCGGDDAESTGGGPSNGSYINAKIDGTAFKTMEVQGYTTGAASKIGTGADAIITISAVDTNTNSMVIALMGVTGEGTYDIGPDSENVVSFIQGSEAAYNSSEDCSGATGTLKVTHYSDEKIEGTFSFTGKNDDCSGSKNVTNGKFRGEFMNQG